MDSGTGQCGAPKGESDAPVAILGADRCIVSDGDARPPTCIAHLHATLPEHQHQGTPHACAPEIFGLFQGSSRNAMQRYDTVDEYDGGG